MPEVDLGVRQRFYLCFDLFYFVSPTPFLSPELCCVLFIHKKTFQLTNAKQISNKSAKFLARNKFLADFFCVFYFVLHTLWAGARAEVRGP